MSSRGRSGEFKQASVDKQEWEVEASNEVKPHPDKLPDGELDGQ
jgi:hypothetical protein